MRARIGRILASSWLVASLLSSAATAQSDANPSSRARRFFETLLSGGATEPLGALRPRPISPEDRERVLAALPREGELRPYAREAEKLASIQGIWMYHERTGIYEAKLIDDARAFIGLHARSILLVTRNALELLTTTELQALVAHEIGHEFFWDEATRARLRRDTQALQEIELKCDGVATLTLLRLGLNPDSLVSGVRKLTRFNEVLGATANAAWYPSLSDREQFVRELVARRAAGRQLGLSATASGPETFIDAASPRDCTVPGALHHRFDGDRVFLRCVVFLPARLAAAF